MSNVNAFDEEMLMVKVHTGNEQQLYHSKLYDQDAHMISYSSEYAADRIICDKNFELGEKIFDKIIALQDVNPESKTYGLWPWYAEETLEEMSPPDYNMSGFNSKEMLMVLFEEWDNISPEMREKMLVSIGRACECIMKRNVSPAYTNVCITECFVTVTAGELIGNERYLNYGRNKFERFLYYVKGKGGILEYNSPTYSILAINDIGDCLKCIKDEQTLDIVKKINFMLWKMTAEHFVYDILQLAGPQERAYADFVDSTFLKTIARGCGIDYSKHPMFKKLIASNVEEGKIRFAINQADYFAPSRTNPKCPEELIPYFTGEKECRDLRRFVTDGYNYPFFEFPKTAITYRSDDYVIGTYNKCEMWNQRRPFLGYIYGETPISFRVKCYHDGFDFSSGTFHAIQHKSNILGSVNFSENRGDTHVCIDMISGGLVDAEDLRVTFELCGDMKNVGYEKDGEILNLIVNGKKIRINAFIKEFGKNEVQESIDMTDNTFQYSLIFYRGERKTVNLCDAEKAMLAFTVEMEPEEVYVKPEYHEEEDMMHISWKPAERKLGLVSPKKTLKFIRNMQEDMQLLDDKNMLDELYNESLMDI